MGDRRIMRKEESWAREEELKRGESKEKEDLRLSRTVLGKGGNGG